VAVHYGFAPKRYKVRRPENKGKVERTIGYLDGNFWPRWMLRCSQWLSSTAK
jgi:transposase